MVPALVAALRDCDPQVRCDAARALGDMGPAARQAVDALAEALWRQPHRLRLEAARALGRIGPAAKSALPDIRELLKVCDDDVRTALTEALVRIAPAGGWQTWLARRPQPQLPDAEQPAAQGQAISAGGNGSP